MLYNHNSSCDAHSHELHNLADDEQMPPSGADWERVVGQVFERELRAGDIDVPTARAQAEQLMDGVVKGFGGDFTDIDYDSPDFGLLKNLERNVYQFSAAKNYQQLKELSLLLKDGDNIRSFTDFRREAMKVVDEWNNTYAKTEYNTAVNGAINARKYQEFQANKAYLPLMRITGVHDDRICGICKGYLDITLPIDHPFWNYGMPPQHFNDRCSVLQLPATAVVTPDSEIPDAEAIPKLFRTNLAKQQLVFPKDHPYFVGLPKSLDAAAMKLQRGEMLAWGRENLVGKSATAPVIGKVGFTNQGLKEWINQPHSMQWEKNQALYNVRGLVADSRYHSSIDDQKGRPFRWHYLETKLGENKNYLVIKEDLQKGSKTVYSIAERIKK